MKSGKPRWQELYEEHKLKQSELEERITDKKLEEKMEVLKYTFRPNINPAPGSENDIDTNT